jgi:hypothetical protein
MPPHASVTPTGGLCQRFRQICMSIIQHALLWPSTPTTKQRARRSEKAALNPLHKKECVQ